jgi:4-carboxymuconolactone decarboxylase
VSRLARLRPAELDAPQRELYGSITTGPRAQGPRHFALTDDAGALNGPFNALLYAPRLGNALQQLGAAVRYETDLTARERELAILIVAAHWGSTFEQHAHEAVGRAAGLTDDDFAVVRGGGVPSLDDPHELAVAEVVLAMANGDLSDADWATASARLSDATIFELSTLVGYYATLALQLRIFRVEE